LQRVRLIEPFRMLDQSCRFMCLNWLLTAVPYFQASSTEGCEARTN